MNYVLPLAAVTQNDRLKVGGKAFSLALMAAKGLTVPPALCVTTEAYNRFLDATGLRSQIIFELYRKPFQEMRWEEIWDAALRIRNLFAKTPIPADLSDAIGVPIQPLFANGAVTIRSSAPGEDSTKTSFIFTFRSGEILICDAMDPNMTFVVPLAAGIVERRGGMLIHGAIIAREYGLPCVTGAADAVALIKTGDQVTVDGYLGIVIIGKAALT